MHQTFKEVDFEASTNKHFGSKVGPMVGMVSVVVSDNKTTFESVGNIGCDIVRQALSGS